MTDSHNVKTELISKSYMATSTRNMIVTCLQKWEAGEKQQWSTFLLCSESVVPGRVTKLQSLGQFEEKIQKCNEERKRRPPHSCGQQVATKKWFSCNYTKWPNNIQLNSLTTHTAANHLTKAKSESTQGSGSHSSPGSGFRIHINLERNSTRNI